MKVSKSDCALMIARIKVNYATYKPYNLADDELELLIQDWHKTFSKYDRADVSKAFDSLLEHSESVPTKAHIVNKIEQMQLSLQKTDEQLWAELMAVKYEVAHNASGYYFTMIEDNGKTQGENLRERNKEIFESLSPELKAYCQNVSGLVGIANIDENEIRFEKARFSHRMPVLRQRISNDEYLLVEDKNAVRMANKWLK